MGDENKQDLRVTIRLIPEKAEVYENFKKTVIDRLHSDVCYVTTMLMESFTNAVNETPNPDDKLAMNFVKQNVQINMGCNFNYMTKKARRDAPDKTEDIITDTRNLLPNIADDFPNLSQKARSFWFEEFKAQGLIPKNVSMDGSVAPIKRTRKPHPPVSDGNNRKPQQKKSSFFGSAWKYCKTIVTGRKAKSTSQRKRRKK